MTKWFKPFSSREWHAIHKPRPDGIELSVCCTWRAVDDAPREERELGAAGNCPACVRILKGREGGAER